MGDKIHPSTQEPERFLLNQNSRRYQLIPLDGNEDFENLTAKIRP